MAGCAVCLHITNCNVNNIDKIATVSRWQFPCIEMEWMSKEWREQTKSKKAYNNQIRIDIFGKMRIRKKEWWWWWRRSKAIALPNQNFSNKLWAIDLNRQKNQDDQFPKPYSQLQLTSPSSHFYFILFSLSFYLFCKKP